MRKSMHNCENVCNGSEAARPDDQLREGRQRVRAPSPLLRARALLGAQGGLRQAAELARDMDKAQRNFCATEQALAQVSEGESTLSADIRKLHCTTRSESANVAQVVHITSNRSRRALRRARILV